MALNDHAQQQADQEKQFVALSSVLAAAFLTGLKLIVGFMTGSLGILAEAAHSALDFLAAVTTYIAVRISGKPADPGHHYGHGKVENFSALIETLLLLATCVWIVWEAGRRLLGKTTVEIDVNTWAFLVMGTSIAVDVTRSRMLMRAAVKHKSQALEADALHFSTDIWSSAVVILGLICVKAGEYIPRAPYLHSLDSVSALVVAAIMAWISVRLGIRAIQELLDAAPSGKADEIVKIVEAMPGVINCHNVRVRHSGPLTFIDIHILVSGEQRLRDVHDLTERIEEAIQNVMPGSDVTVHPEPAEPEIDERGGE